MAVPPSLLPSHSKKVLGAMKAERTVKRITFNPTSANPGETLYVSVPKLAVNEKMQAPVVANLCMEEVKDSTIIASTVPPKV